MIVCALLVSNSLGCCLAAGRSLFIARRGETTPSGVWHQQYTHNHVWSLNRYMVCVSVWFATEWGNMPHTPPKRVPKRVIFGYFFANERPLVLLIRYGKHSNALIRWGCTTGNYYSEWHSINSDVWIVSGIHPFQWILMLNRHLNCDIWVTSGNCIMHWIFIYQNVHWNT